MGEYDVLNKPKSDEAIIDLLNRETKESKIHWYRNDDVIYARKRKISNHTVIDLIFRLYDDVADFDDMDDYYDNYNYYGYMMSTDIIILDIFMKKNNNDEILCRRIKEHQLKLSELTKNVLLKVIKK